ncbi:MAG: hypothetical protein ABSG44_03100 [Thermodesulfobacteriota bacterium]
MRKRGMKLRINLSKVCDWKKPRKISALLFVLLIIFLFCWSINKDSRLKEGQMLLRGFPTGIHYAIQLKSFNPEDQKFNCTLSITKGVLAPKMYLKNYLHYGPLVYDDLSVPYAIGIPIISQKFVAQLGPFKTAIPPPKEITIQAIGNPEIYPFDKYFIMGAIKCPAYFIQGDVKKYLETEDYGESVGIINSINGLFIRSATKRELDQIKAAFNWTKRLLPQVDDKDLRQINNRKDLFALMIVRPYYIRFMTVVLGAFALAIAFYIGFKQPLKSIAISMPGFVIAVWGIRSILLSDTKTFLAYFDYVALFLYLIIFVGITCRLISGGKRSG